jgi:hypothetical protein
MLLIKTHFKLHLACCSYSVKALCSQRPLNQFAFECFDYEGTWWKLFHKVVMRAYLYIFVLLLLQ